MYSPVTAMRYPIRLPTGQYNYTFTMSCILFDHVPMSSISKNYIIATKTIHRSGVEYKTWTDISYPDITPSPSVADFFCLMAANLVFGI